MSSGPHGPIFDVANYNISNAIVNKCLSFRCTTQVGCSTNEFICFHCKTCLQKKTPKMPNQACANGLDRMSFLLNYITYFPLKEE